MILKLISIVLMLISLFAISASGRQKTFQLVNLQDDKSGDHLILAIPTGEYKFESCRENFSTSGVGIVKIDGCKVTLIDISDTGRVLAEVDLCERVGKADITFDSDGSTSQTVLPAVEFILSDSNTADSSFDCKSGSIDPK
ncbi:MAG TPA: hypothetical protein VIG62_25410 [Blastocatellia bacterium]|jgi:hypothetical protein